MDKVPREEEERSLLWIGDSIFLWNARGILGLIGREEYVGRWVSGKFLRSSFNRNLFLRLKGP